MINLTFLIIVNWALVGFLLSIWGQLYSRDREIQWGIHLLSMLEGPFMLIILACSYQSLKEIREMHIPW